MADHMEPGARRESGGYREGALREVATRHISPQAQPAVAPGYQVPLAAAVKKASGIAVEAVGMIVSPHQAEAIIADDQADILRWRAGFSTTRAGVGTPLRCWAPMPSTPRSIVTRVPSIGRTPRWHAPNRAGNRTPRSSPGGMAG